VRERYVVGGRFALTGTLTALCHLWNPSANTPLWVTWLSHIVRVGSNSPAASTQLSKTTSTGTAATTVTPDIDNDIERALAPPSGALLAGDFTVTPTIDASAIETKELEPSGSGGGAIYVFDPPIKVPPGTGLAIAPGPGASVVVIDGDVQFRWRE
jgi:hypothetical protein